MARSRATLVACILFGCTRTVPPPAVHVGAAAHAPLRVEREALTAARPPSVVTLRDAAALALLGNPELAEYSWQVRANEAGELQARARPNPEASVYVEDVLGTGRFRGGEAAQITLQLSQAIELGGKRAARIAAATQSRNVASRDYEIKRIEVVATVTRRFIEVLSAQEVVGLASANLALARATLDETLRRVQAGAGSPLDERKARIEVARSEIVAEHAEHELAMARQELAALWGGLTPAFERVEGELFGRREIPTYEQLSERVSRAPDLLRHVSERQLREAEVRLADAKRIPTPVVAGGIRRLEATDNEAFVFGLSVPLPVGDRNLGGRQEARALLEKTHEAGRTTEVRLRTLLFTLHQELRHAATALDALEREVLPQAEDIVAFSRRGFVEGRFSYLEAADARQMLRAVTRERIDTAVSYHRLVLEIERLIGEPIDEASGVTTGVQP
jgi:outer membrane protein, heavy metal efflux system